MVHQIKGFTNESVTVTGSSAPLMSHDLSDLGSLILIQITPNERSPLVPLSTGCIHMVPAILYRERDYFFNFETVF